MTGSVDLYAVLEVSPRARSSVIQAAYRVLVKEYHPDTGGSSNCQVFRTITDAKDTLLDEEKRREYDDKRENLEGSIVGNYRVLDQIARGGYGTTYRGEHITLGEAVCIKHGHYISPQDEEILIQEAKSIWDLRHYALPIMRDLLRLDDGSFALVMSYVKGPTLEQIIEKNGSLDSEHVAWITDRVLNGLKYLHYHGVVHGDVKPQNVIVQPDEHMSVLVDFGLAAIRPRPTDGSKGYTPMYAAPEQVAGGTIIPETDLYSLGLTMIYSLGGDVGKKEVPTVTPDELCHFIKKLIVRDPLRRPNWEKEDLVDSLHRARESSFGRSRSGMKKIPNF